MNWFEIGEVSHLATKRELLINIRVEYKKALIKLDLFSHCLLLWLMEDRIEVIVTEIRLVKPAQGQLIVTTPQNDSSSGDGLSSLDRLAYLCRYGQLVDIKPYFPVEEVILDAPSSAIRHLIDYRDSAVGEYLVNHNQGEIQLKKAALDEIACKEDVLPSLKKGAYIRLLWWFDRFAKDAFRKHQMCQPPYNHAPKTGIFATRSPVRPNPIGSTIVRVNAFDLQRGRIHVMGFDGFANSKILQIMSYQPALDCISDANVPDWVSHWTAYKKFEQPKAIGETIHPKARALRQFEALDLCDELEMGIRHHGTHQGKRIAIHNAHIHNLKNISVSIPLNSICLIKGVSGSGKSSLAFDTIHAESRRQFTDMVLSNQMTSEIFVDSYVDKITGLQPSIAIEQRALASNPRSTVGTVTKISNILRLIYSIIGERPCPICHQVVGETNVCASCGEILYDRTPQLFSYNHPDYMCPQCKGLGVEARIDKAKIVEFPDKSLLDGASFFYGDLRKHQKNPNANWMRGEILALADDLGVNLEVPFQDLPEAFKKQFFHGSAGRKVSLQYSTAKGRSGVITRPVEGAINLIERLSHDTNSSKVTQRIERYSSKQRCSACQGERLREAGRLVHIMGHRYVDIVNLSCKQLRYWCHGIFKQLDQQQREKTKTLFVELNQRLKRIIDVGLNYITINRSLPSLSGGEAQRLKLASQFGTGLTNMLYIMDEPSKGLHPKDYNFLMDTILALKEQGNTVILVEHKMQFMTIADLLLEIGPKAGRYGGKLTAITHKQAISEQLKTHNNDLTYYDLALTEYQVQSHDCIKIKNVTTNNLKNIDVDIPIGMITAVIGVSGSGKTSLIAHSLYPYLLKTLGKKVEEEGRAESIDGLDYFEDARYVNQRPIGTNSRSNPGTYTGVFDIIRRHYANLKSAKYSKLTKEHFSFNSSKGQCPVCRGLGEIAIDMHYMDDCYITCHRCHGKRYRDEVLDIKYQTQSISDILDSEIHDLIEVFKGEDKIVQQLLMLDRVGLGYLILGQSAPTLSGGEAQRIKLAKALSQQQCKKMLYILDEPTSGLSEFDSEKIIAVLAELKQQGATVIVIEHNIKLIKSCDYIIELGPVGGQQGGYLLKAGYLDKANQKD